MKAAPVIQTEQAVKLPHKMNKHDAHRLAHEIHKSEVAHTESQQEIYNRLRNEVKE